MATSTAARIQECEKNVGDFCSRLEEYETHWMSMRGEIIAEFAETSLDDIGLMDGFFYHAFLPLHSANDDAREDWLWDLCCEIATTENSNRRKRLFYMLLAHESALEVDTLTEEAMHLLTALQESEAEPTENDVGALENELWNLDGKITKAEKWLNVIVDPDDEEHPPLEDIPNLNSRADCLLASSVAKAVNASRLPRQYAVTLASEPGVRTVITLERLGITRIPDEEVGAHAGGECWICQEPLHGDLGRINCPADHVGHIEGCLYPWMLQQYYNNVQPPTCPYCRGAVRTDSF